MPVNFEALLVIWTVGRRLKREPGGGADRTSSKLLDVHSILSFPFKLISAPNVGI